MTLRLKTKTQAWRDILHASGIDDYDYRRADRAYELWQHCRGPKPAPWDGGELDAVNERLETKVSGTMEAFFLLAGNAREWPDLLGPLSVLRQVPGMQNLRLPSEVIEQITGQIYYWHEVECQLFSGATA